MKRVIEYPPPKAQISLIQVRYLGLIITGGKSMLEP